MPSQDILQDLLYDDNLKNDKDMHFFSCLSISYLHESKEYKKSCDSPRFHDDGPCFLDVLSKHKCKGK